LFVFLTYVISSLAYLNLLQNKRLGCGCGGQNDISMALKVKFNQKEKTQFLGLLSELSLPSAITSGCRTKDPDPQRPHTRLHKEDYEVLLCHRAIYFS
jgi:hypothetical protein